MEFNTVGDSLNYFNKNKVPININCQLGQDIVNNVDMDWGTFVSLFNQKLQQNLYTDKDLFYTATFKNAIPDTSYKLILQKLSEYPETLYAIFILITKQKYDYNNVTTGNLFDSLNKDEQDIFINTLKNNDKLYNALKNIPAIIPQWYEAGNNLFHIRLPETYENISGFKHLSELELNKYRFYKCVNDIDIERFYTGKFIFKLRDYVCYLKYEINEYYERLFVDGI